MGWKRLFVSTRGIHYAEGGCSASPVQLLPVACRGHCSPMYQPNRSVIKSCESSYSLESFRMLPVSDLTIKGQKRSSGEAKSSVFNPELLPGSNQRDTSIL